MLNVIHTRNVVAVIVVSLVLLVNKVSAQGFRVDDPNIIYKNKEGKVLPADSVQKLIMKGPFSMQQVMQGDGKIVITILPIEQSEMEDGQREKEEWNKKWLGKSFPDFELKDLNDRTVTSKDLQGKLTVYNFWFIGCKPCIEEIPDLNKLVEKYSKESIMFIAPALDNAEALTKFLDKKKFIYKVLSNAKSLTDKLVVQSYPTHILVDDKGVIKKIFIGRTEYVVDELDLAIQEILNK